MAWLAAALLVYVEQVPRLGALLAEGASIDGEAVRTELETQADRVESLTEIEPPTDRARAVHVHATAMAGHLNAYLILISDALAQRDASKLRAAQARSAQAGQSAEQVAAAMDALCD